MKDRVLQFEIWNECNNACAFCSNKHVYDTTNEEKIRNLDIVEKHLRDRTYIREYSKVGLIGGEFFQGQLKSNDVRRKFFDLVHVINQLLDENIINEYWVTATLIGEDQSDLFEHLRIISDISKVWVCTSYDTIGRFHTDKMYQNWVKNMHILKQIYPKIHINVTSILTGDFIDRYIRGEINVNYFMNEFGSTWFSKPPMLPSESNIGKKEFNDKVLHNFFPKRHRFLEFLMKFRSQETEFEYDKLFNTDLRADSLIKTDYNDHLNRMIIQRNKSTNEEITLCVGNDDYKSGILKAKNINNDTNKGCQHNRAYTPYVDSDACFYCDKMMMRDV